MKLRVLIGQPASTEGRCALDNRPLPTDSGPPAEFHRWPLPGYVWPALERCYASIFCSEPLLRIHQALTSRIEAWVARDDGTITTLILFERVHGCAEVINQVFTLNAAHLQAFSRAVFAQYPQLTAVRLRATALRREGSPASTADYPCLVAPRSDDYLLELPDDHDSWLASLSAQTRDKIRYHWRRAQRRQPTLRFRIVHAPMIDEADVRKVIDYSRARQHSKGKRFGMGPQEERRLCALMLERGQLSLLEIDNEIRAGLLCTHAGDDLMMHVIAHDPAYNDLRLGFLCCAMTVQNAIEQGRARFHFLWGHYDYKVRLGAKRVELSEVLLLRARCAALLHPQRVLAQCQLWLRAVVRQCRQGLATRVA